MQRWRAVWVFSVLTFASMFPHVVYAFCDPPNILIVLDKSGSMNNNNKWTDAKTAIKSVTNTFNNQVRFGLVTFSDNAVTDAQLPSAVSALQSSLDQISPLGQTFMVKAMTQATSEINRSLNADPLPGRPTSILFITDGEPSDRCPGTEVQALRNITVKGVNFDVKTYVVGFGALVNPVCLNDLATRGGTALAGNIKYYVSNSSADLIAAMTTIVSNATQNAKTEVCDNKDNDCDGKVDEKLTRACDNQGCKGQETCAAGSWGNCNAPAPKAETCDNKDNDCDGKIDESLTQSCTNNCGTGSQTCSKGSWGSCNATGNRSCTNNCGTGSQSCSNDTWGACNATGSRSCTNTCGTGTEACSNNTWGACNARGTRACTNACGTGTESCNNNKWGNCSVIPKNESCNNRDDDCDGKTDEGLTRGCCGGGTQTCGAGKWGTCQGSNGSPETCNNKDDDCDGKTDENLTQACTNNCGAGSQTCSSGNWSACNATGTRACTNACGTGSQSCANNKWGSCSVSPSTESCNNKDDDCDGKTDEGLERACGPCGTETCAAGKWGTCVKAAAKPETCDNTDEDCDGKVDEGLSRPCNSGKCTGDQTCSKGKWSTCTLPPESCNDKDEDCDGKIDEGFPDKGKSCGVGQGICYQTGVFKCKADGTGVECSVSAGTGDVEVCDARDNDCDGQSDENLVRDCQHACGEGTQTCKEGSWTVCVQKQGKEPTPEVCNGDDDDCDGKVDEGLVRKCQTACGEGEQTCLRGDWNTCTAPQPRPEICNELDDDCDGKVDEGTASCDNGAKCVSSGCRPKCRNSECPQGQSCEDGYCVGKTCTNVACPDGYVCKDGRCEDLCVGVTCPGDQLCRRGRCVPPDCYAYGCEPGKQCVNGKCVADPCAGKTCASQEYCREGQCISVCNCADDEVCKDDKCEKNTCDDQTCSGADETCREGVCQKRCPEGACHGGQYCKDGVCVHDPCANITCPAGTVCRSGHCTNRPQDPKQGPPGEPIYEEEPLLPEKVDEPVVEGEVTSFEPQDTDGGTTEKLVVDTKTDGVAGEGEVPGCGCQSHQPTESVLFLLLFGLFFLGRRRVSGRAFPSSR
ncbi:MAG: VWA domain-containing protein [Myxococcales bacterium]|nr:VWA domain-containing protein [Myxococcales bacterium]